VTEQFKNKPVFDAYLKLAFDALNGVQAVYKDLMQLRSIETATGNQLDLIGEIIGQPRTLVNYNAFPYFGFDGATAAETFGTISDSTIGGVFRSVNQEEGSSSSVDDETYRFLIKCRIIANTTRATPEAIITGLNFITGNTNSGVVEQPNAHITIEIQNNLTDLQAYFLQGLSQIGSIIPVPIGVAVDYVFFEDEYFGFLEDPNAATLSTLVGGYGYIYGESYGEISADSNVGGYVSNLL
jgi:hypothetical protein